MSKDKTLILCPIKKVNIYHHICKEKCSYYKTCKKWRGQNE